MIRGKIINMRAKEARVIAAEANRDRPKMDDIYRQISAAANQGKMSIELSNVSERQKAELAQEGYAWQLKGNNTEISWEFDLS